MKRDFMKSLCALCTGVMTLCAASSLFVSCENLDETLQAENEKLVNEVNELKQANAKLNEDLKILSESAGALSTLEFRLTADNKLEYSFDGFKTFETTDFELTTGGAQVSMSDDGKTLTITVGENTFTIDVPEEIVFEIRSGKLYFASEATQTVSVVTSGIDDLSILAVPKGWSAELTTDGKIQVTAPNYDNTFPTYAEDDWWQQNPIPAECAATGYVKVHACTANGKCMVGRLSVEVAEDQFVIKAYAGKYEVASTSRWTAVYFGASKKEDYKNDAVELYEILKKYDEAAMDAWTNKTTQDNMSVSGTMTDLLGYEPEIGEEYVVWGYSESCSSPDDLILAYYSPIAVDVEVTKTTPLDIEINITLYGTNSYYAWVLPQSYMNVDLSNPETTEEEVEAELADWKGNLIDELSNPSPWGMSTMLLFNEAYSGSLYGMTEGSGAPAIGAANPGQKAYMYILPLDGARSIAEYTVEDFIVKEFTTAAVTEGGKGCEITAYNPADAAIEEYNPYGYVAAKVEPNTEDWQYCRYTWMTEEEYNKNAGAYYDAVLKDYMASWNARADFSEYNWEKVAQGDTRYLVMIIIDADNKYAVNTIELTSEVIPYQEDFVYTYKWNIVDDVLGAESLEVTFGEETPVTKAKYYWVDITNYYQSPYEGETDESVREKVFLNADSETVDVTDNKLVIDGHSYGSKYLIGILPLTEDGKPAAKPIWSKSYSCTFTLDAVETETLADEPVVTLNIPDAPGKKEEGNSYWREYGDESYMYVSDNYNISYTVEPKANTEVAVAMLESAEALADYATALDKTVALWNKEINDFYTQFPTEKTEYNRSFYSYDDSENLQTLAPAPIIVVSWKSGDKYYYKEIDCTADFQAMYDKLAE